MKFTACSSVQIRVSSFDRYAIPFRYFHNIGRHAGKRTRVEAERRGGERRRQREESNERERILEGRNIAGGTCRAVRAQVSSASLTFDAAGILKILHTRHRESRRVLASPRSIRSFLFHLSLSVPLFLDSLSVLSFSLLFSPSFSRSLARGSAFGECTSPALEADLLRYAGDVTERVSSSEGTCCQLRIVQARSRITNR